MGPISRIWYFKRLFCAAAYVYLERISGNYDRLNFVKSQIDEALVEDANGVELKIKEVLPEKLHNFMDSIGKRTVVDPYLNFGLEKQTGGNWYLVSSAIAQNKTLQFDYERSSDNKITVRKINPYLLVFYGDHWNVIGYSKKRDALRNFILNQISNIRETGKTFTKTTIDIEPLIYRSAEDAKQIKIAVSDAVYERFRTNLPAKINHSDKKGDKHIVTLKFNNLEYINKWLLQFTDKIQILAPEVLKYKREALLKKMLHK